MSTGKIIKPRKFVLAQDLINRPIQEVILNVAQACQVEMDDELWKGSDAEIIQGVQDNQKRTQESFKEFDKKIVTLEKTFSEKHARHSEESASLRKEVEELKRRRPTEITVKLGDQAHAIDLGVQHAQFPVLLNLLNTGLNIYLVGPAGSGKTTAISNCAKALNLPFHFTGAISNEFKLTGFIDAQGRIVSTEFRKAYEGGGVFLFDEIDASYPQAVLAFNAALANDFMDFPDKTIKRHANFYCVAAANTYGQGADRQYVGRNQLDAASLDRFIFLDWRYDENLERHLAQNDDWVEYVQEVRSVIAGLKIRHVVSPRASMFGAKLLANGLDRESVERACLWKGLEESAVSKIKTNLNNSFVPAASNMRGRLSQSYS